MVAHMIIWAHKGHCIADVHDIVGSATKRLKMSLGFCKGKQELLEHAG
jgi:hypothetical protein